MSRFFAALLLLFFLAVGSPPLHAEWLAGGAVVTRGADIVGGHQIIHDGAGGAYVTWSGPGGFDEEVFIQKIDANGNYEWMISGTEVCLEFEIQVVPRIAPDGSGGAIIAWQDYRNGQADIYAQRMDADGYQVWSSIGIAVCTAAGDQTEPYIVSDGEGGAVIAWLDLRAGSELDIYAQRIDSLGNTKWTAGGVAICTESKDQFSYSMITDDAGGAIVVWEDNRSDNIDVYSQRVNKEGLVEWTANGIAICAVAAMQSDVRIVPDGSGGAVIVWRDWRNGNSDIYAQRVTENGNAQWTGNGVPVCISGSNQLPFNAASDGAAGAIVVWYEFQLDSYDLFAQRIDAGGSIQWAAEGIEISTKRDNQMFAQLVPDDAGGAVIAWQDYRTGDGDIYAQRVDSGGNVLWRADGVPICTELNSMGPQITSVNGDTVIVVWRDYRRESYDLYAQKLDGGGRVSFLTPEIAAICDVPGDQGGWARIHLIAPSNDSDEIPYYPTTFYNVWRKIQVGALGSGAGRPISAAENDIEALLRVVFDSGKTPGKILTREQASLLGLPPGEWESIGIHPAAQEPDYYLLVPTNNDSTVSGIPWEQCMITAHTSNPLLFFHSDPDSGYSVDNLAPAQPRGFSGEQSLTPQGVRLSWLPNTEPDLYNYAVHRGDDESFIPGAANRIGTTTDTVLIDTEWIPSDYYFYKLTAVDVHGNMGVEALLRPEDINLGTLLQSFAANYDGSAVVVTWTLSESGEGMLLFASRAVSGTGVFRELADSKIQREGLTFRLIDKECEPGESYRYRIEVEDEQDRRTLFETEAITVPALPLTLYQNHPNPFNPITTIRYYLPGPARVTLEIYDITGKRIVCLVEGEQRKGLHSIEWNGIDESGNGAASGLYFYRLKAGKRAISKKMILLR